MEKAESQIRGMVRRIVERFDPARVILFGSHARGDAGMDSDVDLLVVMHSDGGKRRRRVEVRMALRDFPVPKDILITTPAAFEARKDIPGTIEYPAHREGRVMYVRGKRA